MNLKFFIRYAGFVLVAVLIFYFLYSEQIGESFIFFKEQSYEQSREKHIADTEAQKNEEAKVNHEKRLKSWNTCQSDNDCLAIVLRCGIYSANKEHFETAQKYYEKMNAMMNCRSSPQPQISDYKLACVSKTCTLNRIN